MSRHAHRSLRAPVLLLLLAVIALNLAAAVLWAAYRLLPLVVLAGLAWCGWQLARRRRILPPQGRGKVLQGHAEPDHTADLEAENADLRRQVAKLEHDAARHDDLIERLENVTGRPVEAVIASYEHAQRIYGPAAVSKSGGQP